ncbi:MAG: hypothetical protein WCT11_03425 [Candidatus Magasanikbacteria bacterium]
MIQSSVMLRSFLQPLTPFVDSKETILKRFIVATLAMIVGFSTTTAGADTFSASRVRMLIHGSNQFSEQLGASVHFIPAGNLLGEVAPLIYGSFDWTPIPELTISPTVGWTFKPDEMVVSLRLAPKIGKFWGWVDLEERPTSRAFYWFVQAQYQVTSFLHIGAEQESWGDFHDFSTASHGGGPNVLLRFGRNFGTDLALHARSLGGSAVNLEFFSRIHLFL